MASSCGLEPADYDGHSEASSEASSCGLEPADYDGHSDASSFGLEPDWVNVVELNSLATWAKHTVKTLGTSALTLVLLQARMTLVQTLDASSKYTVKTLGTSALTVVLLQARMTLVQVAMSSVPQILASS